MSDNKPDDLTGSKAFQANDVAGDQTDLPPLPELKSSSDGAEPSRTFVPKVFTPDLLAGLREAPDTLKRRVLKEQLARRASFADNSEIASVLDERIAQLRATLNLDQSESRAFDPEWVGPPLKAIVKDEEQREKAEKTLVRALQSYINKLRSAKNRDAHRETEIFCDYARENYASRAEKYLEATPPIDPKQLFDVGDLTERRDPTGLPTIGDVDELVKKVEVQRPDHWRHPAGCGDAPELGLALRRLRERESFRWLLEEPYRHWFWQQIRDCVRECVRKKRKEYEQRFTSSPEAKPELADSTASKADEATPAQPATVANDADSGGGASWQGIEISFLSDERVQIRHGTNTETCNYAELGFADRRVQRGKPKPNQAWVTLRAMAEWNGIIGEGAKTGMAWSKVEKRMQEIRKALRRHFGISADPAPYVSGTGYQARFKIHCAPSFHT